MFIWFYFEHFCFVKAYLTNFTLDFFFSLTLLRAYRWIDRGNLAYSGYCSININVILPDRENKNNNFPIMEIKSTDTISVRYVFF